MPTIWKSESLILDGQSFLQSLVQVVDEATETLDLEFYIFEPGVLATALFNALARAKARGVKIRLLVDGIGAHNFVEDFEADIDEIGLDYKIYHPVPWHFTNYKVSFAWWPSTVFQLLGHMNNRNHRKVVVADGTLALVGSFNISDVHLPKPLGEQWLDIAVRIEGQNVAFLVSAFEHAWEGWLGYHKSLNRWFGIRTYITHIKAERFFLLNHTLRLRKSVRDRFHKQLRNAKSRIWVTTPYFAPSLRFIGLMVKAAKRGVDVRLMIPRHNDVTFMYWVLRTYYARLLKKGIRIFEYKPSVLHAKTAIVDDWIEVGSTNLNSRSLFHDLEANYLLQMMSTKNQIVQFISDKFENDCDEILDTKKVVWWQQLLGRFALIFKYWI